MEVVTRLMLACVPKQRGSKRLESLWTLDSKNYVRQNQNHFLSGRQKEQFITDATRANKEPASCSIHPFIFIIRCVCSAPWLHLMLCGFMAGCRLGPHRHCCCQQERRERESAGQPRRARPAADGPALRAQAHGQQRDPACKVASTANASMGGRRGARADEHCVAQCRRRKLPFSKMKDKEFEPFRLLRFIT